MDFNARFRQMAIAMESFPAKSAILDGELVANNAKGVPDFHSLRLCRAQPHELLMWVFDILEYHGDDLWPLPLVKRRLQLERLMHKIDTLPFYLSETFDDPERLLVACNERGLEGIVSKRMNAPYRSGESNDWIKVKCAAWRVANRERRKQFER
jgi:bifunctional non-homologous end joining protein LigD